MTQNVLASTEKRPSSGAMLSIRLWTSEPGEQPDSLFWKSPAPVVSLTLDVILASDGDLIATHGKTLVTDFPDIPTAISAAKRIQWAVQGFAESEDRPGTAAAVLVHSTESQPGTEAENAAWLPLEHASPGQILLSGNTCQLLQDLPGFPLEPTSDRSLWELRWRSPDARSNPEVDERSLVRIFEQNGVPDPYPSLPQEKVDRTTAPITVEHPVVPVAADPKVLQPPQNATAERPSAPWSDRLSRLQAQASRAIRYAPVNLGSPRAWLIGAAGVLACALLIGLIVSKVHSKPSETRAMAEATPLSGRETNSGTSNLKDVKTASGPVKDPTATTQGKSSPTTPATGGNASDSVNQDSTQKKIETVRSGAVPSPKAIKIPSEACTLVQPQYASALQVAEKSREEGHYQDAENGFRQVLACDPKNQVALTGAARARSELEARHTPTHP